MEAHVLWADSCRLSSWMKNRREKGASSDTSCSSEGIGHSYSSIFTCTWSKGTTQTHMLVERQLALGYEGGKDGLKDWGQGNSHTSAPSLHLLCMCCAAWTSTQTSSASAFLPHCEHLTSISEILMIPLCFWDMDLSKLLLQVLGSQNQSPRLEGWEGTSADHPVQPPDRPRFAEQGALFGDQVGLESPQRSDSTLSLGSLTSAMYSLLLDEVDLQCALMKCVAMVKLVSRAPAEKKKKATEE